jgi:hypothetical protein
VLLLGGFVVRQVGRSDRLLPLRVITDRVRGLGMITLIVNSVSTFGMFPVLTYQLQSVMGYSALWTGLAIVPFAVTTGLGSALLAPRLMRAVPLRMLLTVAVAVAAGYLTGHAGAGTAAATVHGFAVAMAWGVGIMLAAAVPVIFLVNAKVVARR